MYGGYGRGMYGGYGRGYVRQPAIEPCQPSQSLDCPCTKLLLTRPRTSICFYIRRAATAATAAAPTTAAAATTAGKAVTCDARGGDAPRRLMNDRLGAAVFFLMRSECMSWDACCDEHSCGRMRWPLDSPARRNQQCVSEWMRCEVGAALPSVGRRISR